MQESKILVVSIHILSNGAGQGKLIFPIATPRGRLPTVIVSTTVLVFVAITATLLSQALVT